MKKKLGDKLRSLFNRFSLDEEFFEDMEDALVEADLGPLGAVSIVNELKQQIRKKKTEDKQQILAELKQILADKIITRQLELDKSKLNIILVLGVNGTGKTTSIARLANYCKKNIGFKKIVFAAADTFRAAAIEQLHLQAEKCGCRVVAQQQGSDPAAVVFDALESVLSQKDELLIIDTAGRMHNKANLVNQLEKIQRVIQRKAPEAHYQSFLVLDATTGQNALQQAEVFNQAVDISGIILSKFDSTAKGGMVISISEKTSIPFTFLGTGESLDDFRVFDKDYYLSLLLDGL